MRLSQLDGLTGIANRPRFIELAESALDDGAKSTQEVSVVLCDLDHFKSINDKHGHAAGDFVLKQTVTACQMHLRSSDIFGRFGGEEFAVVLPGCNLHDARLRAEQLRLAIAAISGSYDGVELTVSASFGDRLHQRRPATNCGNCSRTQTPRCIEPSMPAATASCSRRRLTRSPSRSGGRRRTPWHWRQRRRGEPTSPCARATRGQSDILAALAQSVSSSGSTACPR